MGEAVFRVLEYLGFVFTAYAVLRLGWKLVRNSTTRKLPGAKNPLSLRSLWLLCLYEVKTDLVIVMIFIPMGGLLLLKLIVGPDGFPDNYFLEFITLLCILHFAIDFHLHPLEDDSASEE